MRAYPQRPEGKAPRQRQRGVAALEFSLTLTLLLHPEQRAAVYARFNGQADVPTAACLAAMGSFSAGSAVLCSTTRAPCAWTGAGGRQADCATVAMTYNTQSWPLLEIVRGLITALPGTNRNWVPSRLHSQAVVQISQGTP